MSFLLDATEISISIDTAKVLLFATIQRKDGSASSAQFTLSSAIYIQKYDKGYRLGWGPQGWAMGGRTMDARIVGTSMQALVQNIETMGWEPSEIDLSERLTAHDGEIKKGFFDSCKNVKFDRSKGELCATAQRLDGSWQDTTIALNPILGFEHGDFQWGLSNMRWDNPTGERPSGIAREWSVRGCMFGATFALSKSTSGYYPVQRTVNLNQGIINVDGKLQVAWNSTTFKQRVFGWSVLSKPGTALDVVRDQESIFTLTTSNGRLKEEVTQGGKLEHQSESSPTVAGAKWDQKAAMYADFHSEIDGRPPPVLLSAGTGQFGVPLWKFDYPFTTAPEYEIGKALSVGEDLRIGAWFKCEGDLVVTCRVELENNEPSLAFDYFNKFTGTGKHEKRIKIQIPKAFHDKLEEYCRTGWDLRNSTIFAIGPGNYVPDDGEWVRYTWIGEGPPPEGYGQKLFPEWGDLAIIPGNSNCYRSVWVTNAVVFSTNKKGKLAYLGAGGSDDLHWELDDFKDCAKAAVGPLLLCCEPYDADGSSKCYAFDLRSWIELGETISKPRFLLDEKGETKVYGIRQAPNGGRELVEQSLSNPKTHLLPDPTDTGRPIKRSNKSNIVYEKPNYFLRIKTADSVGAAYKGARAFVHCWSGNQYAQAMISPKVERGDVSYFSVGMTIDHVDYITIETEAEIITNTHSTWAAYYSKPAFLSLWDHWTIEKVDIMNMTTGKQWYANINKVVPDVHDLLYSDKWKSKHLVSLFQLPPHVPALPGTGKLTILVWPSLWYKGGGMIPHVGHAAIEIENGPYISFWPKDEFALKNSVAGDGKFHTSRYEDITMESADLGGEATFDPIEFSISGLNVEKIKAWYYNISKNPPQYWIGGMQCSAMAWTALTVGGVPLSKDDTPMIAHSRDPTTGIFNWSSLGDGTWKFVWTPGDLITVAMILREKGYY